MALTTEQYRCIESPEGDRAIVAVPGSGKTTVLTTAIASLLESGEAHASWIAAMTFTRNAAWQMKKRLADMTGEARAVTIGTIHSIAYSIVCDHYKKLGYRDREILIYGKTDHDAVLDETGAEHGKTRGEARRAIATPGPVQDTYRHILLEHNAIEYALIIKMALELIEDHDIMLPWRHIFVDEAQDLDQAQAGLLTAIQYRYEPKIVFVGDPDQSIYSWRGADRRIMTSWSEDMEILTLKVNHRSADSILEVAQSVIRLNEGREEVALMAPAQNPEGVRSVIGQNEALELMSETSDLRTAILVRTQREAAVWSGRLSDWQVPHTLVGRRSRLIDREQVQRILAWLCFPECQLSPPILERVMSATGMGKVGIATLMRDAKVVGRTFYEEACRSKGASKGVRDLYKTIGAALPGDLDVTPDGLVQQFLGVIQVLKMLGYETLPADAADLRSALLEYVSMQRWSDRSGMNFISWLNMLDSQDEVWFNDTANHVLIMTVHGAKGLEFDRVFIGDLTIGVFPSHRSDLDEERRLFYVAMTRAIMELYVMTPNPPKEYSRFIREFEACPVAS